MESRTRKTRVLGPVWMRMGALSGDSFTMSGWFQFFSNPDFTQGMRGSAAMSSAHPTDTTFRDLLMGVVVQTDPFKVSEFTPELQDWPNHSYTRLSNNGPPVFLRLTSHKSWFARSKASRGLSLAYFAPLPVVHANLNPPHAVWN